MPIKFVETRVDFCIFQESIPYEVAQHLQHDKALFISTRRIRLMLYERIELRNQFSRALANIAVLPCSELPHYPLENGNHCCDSHELVTGKISLNRLIDL